MIRRARHMHGFPWRLVSSEGTKRTLSVLLTVALTLSTIPLVAVRAFAEEITPAVDAAVEVVGDVLEDIADATTVTFEVPEANPEPEPEVAPTEEPVVAPEEAPEAEPVADPEAEPVAEPEPIVVDEPVAIEIPTQIESDEPALTSLSPDSTVYLGVGYADTDAPGEDGTYPERNPSLIMQGNNITLYEDTKVTVTYLDSLGVPHTEEVEYESTAFDPVMEGANSAYFLDFKLTKPGTYVNYTVEGGACTVDGDTVSLFASLDLDTADQYTIGGDFPLSVALLDADGNILKDDDGIPVSVFNATPESPVGEGATGILVRIDNENLNSMSWNQVESASQVRLYKQNGGLAEFVAFEYNSDGGYYEATITNLSSTTLDYIREGKYCIQIIAEDLYGNKLTDDAGNEFVLIGGTFTTGSDGELTFTPDGSICFNGASPEVYVTYPHGDAVATYTPTTGDNVVIQTADVPQKVDFFRSTTAVEITIIDMNIDEDNTTIFGKTLHEIFADMTGAVPGVSFSVTTTYVDDNGAKQMKIVATCSEGLYDVSNLVSASDGVDGHEPTVIDHVTYNGEDLDITHFIVDTDAPSITQAMLGSTPYDLGNDADGNPIVNGADNNGNRVYFVEAANSNITLTVSENFGIRAVEFYDTTGTYLGKVGDFSSALSSGNSGLTTSGHTGTYTFEITSELVEGLPYPDDILVAITDFAGNQYIWSMAEQGWYGTVDSSLLNSTTNTDLSYNDGGSTLAMGHPTLLVPDETAPEVALEGPDDRTDAPKPEYKRIYNTKQDILVSLIDSSVMYLQGFEGGDSVFDPNSFIDGTFDGIDPDRVVVTIIYTPDEAGATPQTWELTLAELDLWGTTNDIFGWDYTCETNGDYEISADFSDVAGLNATDTIDKFTIDTVAPVVEVTYEPDSTHASQSLFYNETITATITVTEHNFDPDLFTITPSVIGGAADQVAPTPSAWTDNGDTHTCTVVFNGDGTFYLQVEGQDKAGNEANAIDDGPFVIDTEAPAIAKYYANGSAPSATFDTDDPVVEIPAATGTYDDGSGITYYFTHPIDVNVKVQDRNFDVDGTTLYVTKDGTEAVRDVTWDGSVSDAGPNGRVLYTTTVSYADDGEYTAPHVITWDSAGNKSDNETDASAMKLVVDVNPPELTVDVNRDPSAQGMDGGNPVNFYNQSTTMTFTVTDAHLLRSVEIEDPDGLYTITKSDASAEGKGSVTLTANLVDGNDANDGEFDRDITLTAVDLAGNSRTWNISPTGRITQDSVTSETGNVGINGGTEYPLALIQDTVAPTISLEGVTAGTYYNSPQQVLATINEYNMEYLQQFDGGRTIITVTNWSADAGRTQSTFTINAGEFSGSRPTYTFTQNFNTDGHYALEAQFQDFAGNLSNRVTIGQFTIDMTDPVIDVTWNNDSVRNGKYYNATRTATITVTEHNFDASRFTINTTGSIGNWIDNGDTHTITVFFGEGSAHNLSVSGSDLAGNQAREYSSPEFVVDLTAPEITIAGTAQRLGYLDDEDSDSLVDAYLGTLETYNAYNGVVVPTITYTDNEALDNDDLAYTIVGNKNGEDIEVRVTTSPESTEVTKTFEDLGYVGPDAGDGSNANEFYVDDYDVNYDDIYTLTATMTDQAGNEAEATIIFSVNRYGSNYIVTVEGLDPAEEQEFETTGVVSQAPTIIVHEINVCGVDEDAHHVQKEFANMTSSIAQQEGAGAGYGLETIENKDQEVGWSEYIYTIRSANFGEGSDSDNNDNGQGLYRVNVMSDDFASNANSTAAFWRSDSARRAVDADGATTEFILDELAPVIDDLTLPEHFSVGEAFEASFHITDDITNGNRVQVFIDGEELSASEIQGPSSGVGTYTFNVPAKAFDWGRSIEIVVTDYAGRVVEANNGEWIWQSTFIPEGLAAAGVVAVGITGAVVAHKRKAAAEPELPE